MQAVRVSFRLQQFDMIIKSFIDRVKFALMEFFGMEKFREIYYVNGPEELPPPLSPEEEKENIERLEKDENDIEARNMLVEHNLRLVVYIAKKFENTGIGTEDLISIGTIGLIKGVMSFKSEKNIKLATYASKCIENEILMFIRRINPSKLEISIDEPLNVDWDGNELLLGDVLGSDGDEVNRDIEREEDKKTIYEAIEKLSARDKEIISMRFGLYGKKELTQKEVAAFLGISQSYISRLEKRIISRLKKEIISKI